MQVTQVAHGPTTIQPSMLMLLASSQGDVHSTKKAREAVLEMHAESVGSGATKEALTVLPMAKSAGSAASPITSKLSATVGTEQGVPQLARARQARRKGRSHLAKRPNSKQIQSYCKKWSQKEETQSLQHQLIQIRKMLRMGHETRSFQDHHFKQL